MARKNYSEDFRRQAIDLYLNTPGATFKAIAADLGIARGTLQNWVYAQHPEGRPSPEPTASTTAPAKGESAAAKTARLEAALANEQAERRKLETELIDRTAFATRAEAQREVFSYVEGFYNPWLRHSANGQLSPAEYERRHTQQARSGPTDLTEAA
ncbi:transposase [Nocardiopsis synnemataformans]|uniref:transposase n=1 Tax=Nocardiopsis synnemataformans TaxID=61305 RepID=UPI003EBC210E